jgi:hypothetical protein
MSAVANVREAIGLLRAAHPMSGAKAQTRIEAQVAVLNADLNDRAQGITSPEGSSNGLRIAMAVQRLSASGVEPRDLAEAVANATALMGTFRDEVKASVMHDAGEVKSNPSGDRSVTVRIVVDEARVKAARDRLLSALLAVNA